MFPLQDMRKYGKIIANRGTVPYKEDVKCPRDTHITVIEKSASEMLST